MKYHRIGMLVVLAAAVGCSKGPAVGEQASPIVDGRLATTGDVGSTVALIEPGWSGASCTGTLVTPNVVVTAAHCLFTDTSTATTESFGPLMPASDVRVVVGAVDPTTASTPQIHPAAFIWADPRFLTDYNNDTDENDIGAIVLATPVTRIAPTPVLDLSSLDTELTPRRMLDIAGYGTTNRAGMGDNTFLYLAQVPFISRTEHEVTAGDPGGPDTCYGDSGGPLYVDTDQGRRLVGATSRGAGPDVACDSGTVFTLVPAYVAEIEAAIGMSLTSASPPPPVDAGGLVPIDAGAPGPVDSGMFTYAVDSGTGPVSMGNDAGGYTGADAGPTSLPPRTIGGGCSAAGDGSMPNAPFVSLMLVALVALRPRRRRARRGE